MKAITPKQSMQLARRYDVNAPKFATVAMYARFGHEKGADSSDVSLTLPPGLSNGSVYDMTQRAIYGDFMREMSSFKLRFTLFSRQ